MEGSLLSYCWKQTGEGITRMAAPMQQHSGQHFSASHSLASRCRSALRGLMFLLCRSAAQFCLYATDAWVWGKGPWDYFWNTLEAVQEAWFLHLFMTPTIYKLPLPTKAMPARSLLHRHQSSCSNWISALRFAHPNGLKEYCFIPHNVSEAW